MKLILELVKLEPYKVTDKETKEEKIRHYDVGFNIEHEDGISMYAPTTITFKDGLTEADVIQAAAKEVLPGQIAIAFNLLKIAEENSVN